MKSNLNGYERGARLVLGALFIFSAVALFQHPAARVLAVLAAVYTLWESATGYCHLHARFGVKSPSDDLKTETRYMFGLLLIQAVLAYEWWTAAWEKVSSTAFVEGIDKTLGFFASKNPFPWYQAFLTGFASAHSASFAYAVESGEILTAVALAGSASMYVYARNDEVRRLAALTAIFGLVAGLLMNANFYLAAGWTGPGTKGSNVVMFWIQAVLLYVWLWKAKAKK